MSSEHFVEILANIERMGDHLENICESIANEDFSSSNKKANAALKKS